MAHYLVTTAIDGPQHATFHVEADSRDEAEQKASYHYGDSTLIRRGYDTHGKIEHVVSADEVGRNRRPEWTVSGVYTDTTDLYPFQFEVPAEGAREAVAQAIARMRYGDDKEQIDQAVPEIMSKDLKHVCRGEDAAIASVRPTYQLKPQEMLFEISEFAA